MAPNYWHGFLFLIFFTLFDSGHGFCKPNGALSSNPADCATYFQCDNGNLVLRPCAAGTHFNPRTNGCDWPQNANCRQFGPTTQPPRPETPVDCYSCSYIQGRVNQSNVGCENDPPPRKYLRKDCYGFGNLEVAGGYRHSAGLSHGPSSAYHPRNTHCVKISGKTDAGTAVVMRGCEDLTEFDKQFSTWTCFSKRDYEFALPGTGMVRNVQKCYCKGKSCNGSTVLEVSKILLALLFAMFYATK